MSDSTYFRSRARALADRAADLITERGWARGAYQMHTPAAPGGWALCTNGAINLAAGSPSAHPLTYTAARASMGLENLALCHAVKRALIAHVGAADMPPLPGAYAAPWFHQPCYDDHYGRFAYGPAGTIYLDEPIAEWNDGDVTDAREVIDALRSITDDELDAALAIELDGAQVPAEVTRNPRIVPPPEQALGVFPTTPVALPEYSTGPKPVVTPTFSNGTWTLDLSSVVDPDTGEFTFTVPAPAIVSQRRAQLALV